MNKSKFVIQIINHQNGNRSEPFEAGWDELAESLKKAEEIDNDNYLLLVAVVDPENEKMRIPKSPLITIATFLDMFANEQLENTQNG